MTTTDADTRAAFLRDICERPDDDAPRLIFADWLTDHGEPGRAEFVRVQVDLAMIARQQDEFSMADISHFDYDRAAVSRRQDALRRRERELLRDHYFDWMRTDLNDARLHVLYVAATTVYHRGFVDTIHCTRAAWHEHGPAVVRAAPVVKLVITDMEPMVFDDAAVWFCRDTQRAPLFQYCPDEWLDHLADYRPGTVTGTRVFPGREAALRAIGHAALASARDAAGLPPLS